MTLTLLDPPQAIISLDDAKALMRVTGSNEDPVITMLLDASQAEIEPPDGWVGRAFGTQKWRMTFSGCNLWPHSRVELPFPPVQQVDQIQIRTCGGDVAPFTDFDVVKEAQQTFVQPASGSFWPRADDGVDAVTIDFTCGYDADDPQIRPARLALCLMASALRSLPQGDVFVRREQVEGIVTREFALNDKAASLARSAADVILARYRIWKL